MTVFRKKPVTVSAVQFNDGRHDDGQRPGWLGFSAWPDWLSDALDSGKITTKVKHDCAGQACGLELKIHTLEGVMTAIPGDWIIQGVRGEIYPCKPDIFAETYEPDGQPARLEVPA